MEISLLHAGVMSLSSLSSELRCNRPAYSTLFAGLTVMVNDNMIFSGKRIDPRVDGAIKSGVQMESIGTLAERPE